MKLSADVVNILRLQLMMDEPEVQAVEFKLDRDSPRALAWNADGSLAEEWLIGYLPDGRIGLLPL